MSVDTLLRDYRPGPHVLPAVLLFWLAWLALRGLLEPQGFVQQVLGLSAQLWLGYSAAWWALAWLGRRPSWHWAALVSAIMLGGALSGLAGLPLLADFSWQRAVSPEWLFKQLTKPLAAALGFHLIPLFLRWREARRHQAEAARLREKATVADLSRQVTLAELKTLQAQVEPHFLYNTLAGIQYLVRHNPPLADRMLGRLHDYLRLALPAMREPMSTLAREFALAEAYLALMQMRLGEQRLRITLTLPDALAAQPFPPLMLGSLIENAIQHGIEPKPEGGELRVAAALVDGQLEISVSDSGVGLQAAAAGRTAGSGLGLSSLRERLRLLYGETAARLEVGANAQGGVSARVLVPIQLEQVAA